MQTDDEEVLNRTIFDYYDNLARHPQSTRLTSRKEEHRESHSRQYRSERLDSSSTAVPLNCIYENTNSTSLVPNLSLLPVSRGDSREQISPMRTCANNSYRIRSMSSKPLTKITRSAPPTRTGIAAVSFVRHAGQCNML